MKDEGTHHDKVEDNRILSGIDVKPIFRQAKRGKYLLLPRSFREIFAGSQHLSKALRRSGNWYVEIPVEAYPGGTYFADGDL